MIVVFSLSWIINWFVNSDCSLRNLLVLYTTLLHVLLHGKPNIDHYELNAITIAGIQHVGMGPCPDEHHEGFRGQVMVLQSYILYCHTFHSRVRLVAVAAR